MKLFIEQACYETMHFRSGANVRSNAWSTIWGCDRWETTTVRSSHWRPQ